MNKKFTMMLAAFVAAGYTITAEAGVVKVSKPVSGETYIIANSVIGENGYRVLSGAKYSTSGNDENRPTIAVVTEEELENCSGNQLWTVFGEENGNYSLIVGKQTSADSQDALNSNLYIGTYSDEGSNPTYNTFNINQVDGANIIYSTTNPYYVDVPNTASDGDAIDYTAVSSSPSAASKLAFYAITTPITNCASIQIAGKYLSAKLDGDKAVLELVSALDYVKNPVEWNADASGNVYVELGEEGKEEKYWIVTETPAETKTVTSGDELKLVKSETAPTAAAAIETLTQGTTTNLLIGGLYITSDLKLTDDETKAATAGTAANLDNVTLPTVSGGAIQANAIANGISGDVMLYSYDTDRSGYLEAASGKSTVVESKGAEPKAYYWNLSGSSIVAKDGTKLAVAGVTSFEVVVPEENAKYFFLYAKDKGFVQVDGQGELSTGDAKDATAFSAIKEELVDISGSELMTAAQGAFSLTYKIGNDEVENLFKNVTAIEVDSDISGSYVAGTYFVVDAPDNFAHETKDDLDKLTFVAISPVKSDNFVFEDASVDNGAGYTLTTVKGEDLVPATSAAINDITYNNIAFDVQKGVINTGELKVTPKGSFYVNDEENEVLVFRANTNIVIAAVKGANGSLFVSTFNTESDSKITNDPTATLTTEGVVKYADFLGTDAKIYNIQFLSTTASTTSDKTKSEYNKYLGVGEDTDKLLAQGADFVDLSLPQNQWVVSEMTEDNVVTFTNRESGQEISSKLVKVADNEYRLAGCDFGSNTVYYMYLDKDNNNAKDADNEVNVNNNLIVKLTPVTAGKNDGYVSGALSENDMVKIAFTPTSSITVNELFLTVDNNKNTSLKSEGAAEFEVIKTAQKKTASHTTSIAVLKDGKPTVSSTIADTLNVVTYAFKQVIADKTNYLKADMSVMEETTNPAQFMIKKLNNGKLALVAYSTDFETSITENTTIFDANLENGEVTNSSTNTIYKAVDEPAAYISFVGQDAAISLPAKSQHVLFNNEGAYMAVNENNAAVIDGPSELKAEYTKEQLTFWLDTTDSEAIVPTFYITKGSKQFMFNAIDSLSRYNEGTASAEEVKAYMMPDNEAAARAIFRAATLKDSDTLTTSINGESKDLTADKGIEAYQYKIVLKDKAVADEYVVRSVKNGSYLYESNGALGFTLGNNDEAKAQAIVFTIESTEAPTSNEGVSASDVKVVAQNGSVVVMNAAGKNVVVSTILGQVVVNEVLTSDNATINVPAGIVVVAVEGESFKVNVK